jgi:hypothetical protein
MANYDRALTTFDAPSDGPDHQDLVVARDEAARTWVRREITSALAGISEMNVAERLTRIRTARKTAESRKLDDVRAEADAAAGKALEIMVGVIKALTETGELHEAAVLARALGSLDPPLAAHSAEIEKLDKDARDKARAMYMKLLEELNADPQDDVAGKLLVTGKEVGDGRFCDGRLALYGSGGFRRGISRYSGVKLDDVSSGPCYRFFRPDHPLQSGLPEGLNHNRQRIPIGGACI